MKSISGKEGRCCREMGDVGGLKNGEEKGSISLECQDSVNSPISMGGKKKRMLQIKGREISFVPYLKLVGQANKYRDQRGGGGKKISLGLGIRDGLGFGLLSQMGEKGAQGQTVQPMGRDLDAQWSRK